MCWQRDDVASCSDDDCMHNAIAPCCDAEKKRHWLQKRRIGSGEKNRGRNIPSNDCTPRLAVDERFENSLKCMPLRRRHAWLYTSIIQPYECCVATKSAPAVSTGRQSQQLAASGLRRPRQAIPGTAEVRSLSWLDPRQPPVPPAGYVLGLALLGLTFHTGPPHAGWPGSTAARVSL